MTSECKTLGDVKDNSASSSQNTKKQQNEDNHNKKTEKQPQNKSTDNKEKFKNPTLQNQFQAKNQECQNLKTQILKLQKDLSKKLTKSKRERSTNTSTPNQAETCMTDIIVEKTRMLKNQELQIEALTQQVNSLKEVINITKDMLDIRNVEVKQLRDKLHCMDIKFGAEKDRHEIIHSKLERMVTLNTELKNEYKKQLFRFTDLQKKYHEHVASCNNHLITEKARTANEKLVSQPGDGQTEEELQLSNETQPKNQTESEFEVKKEALQETQLQIDATLLKEPFVQVKEDTEQKLNPECVVAVPSLNPSCDKQISEEKLNNEDIVKDGVVEK